MLRDIKNGSTVDDPQYRWKLNGSDIASRFTPVYATTKQDPRVGKRRFSLGGRGGAGGGAIELVAVNDLEIGEFCHIRVDAAPGHESNNAGGGGGSGGSVLLAAGGVIRLRGTISARGGAGGAAPRGGGGGGGGRVALYANALWRPDDVSARIDVAGGACREWTPRPSASWTGAPTARRRGSITATGRGAPSASTRFLIWATTSRSTRTIQWEAPTAPTGRCAWTAACGTRARRASGTRPRATR